MLEMALLLQSKDWIIRTRVVAQILNGSAETKIYFIGGNGQILMAWMMKDSRIWEAVRFMEPAVVMRKLVRGWLLAEDWGVY